MQENNPIALICSPSMRDNNLSYDQNNDKLYFINGDQIATVSSTAFENAQKVKPDTYCSLSEQNFRNLVFAKICAFDDSSLLVASDTNGLHFVLTSNKAEISINTLQDDNVATSIDFLEIGDCRLIVAADNKGLIYLFTFSTGNTIELKRVVSSSLTEGISYISTSNYDNLPVLVAAGVNGQILVWNIDTDSVDISLLHTIEGFSFATVCPNLKDTVTCVKATHGNIYASYATGKIRIFNLKTSKLSIEVQAHIRWIHAMDASALHPFVVTVGEDALIQLWRVSTSQEDSNIQLLSSHRVKDSVLIGAQFCNKDDKMIIAGAFEKSVLFTWDI